MERHCNANNLSAFQNAFYGTDSCSYDTVPLPGLWGALRVYVSFFFLQVPHSFISQIDFFLVFEAFPIIFGEKRGFSIGSVGLTFIGIGIGIVVGCVITYATSHKYNSLVQKWRGFPPPEERLYGGMIAGPLFVIGIFWLGWAGAYPSVHWIVPELGAVIIGACISLTFNSFLVRFFFLSLLIPTNKSLVFFKKTELYSRCLFVSPVAEF